MIITIDGPAGSGKSTVAKLVAQKLDFMYIDSGSLYRTIAYFLIKNKLNTNLATHIKKINIKYNYSRGKAILKLNNIDVTEQIRTEEVSGKTSEISKLLYIRDFITQLQRDIAKNHNVVLEGRDAGTVVFPNAEYKFFINASMRERAKRRFVELKAKNEIVSFSQIYNNIRERDNNDKNRKHAPLLKPKGSLVINTTSKSIDEVVDIIIKKVDNK